ncbi:MAG: MAPEG family protein [Candidatus Caenarcaniphilales bacterium]|nr:MAPEG family protein [Candidatus Caenarcaniphilales bacterium]
MLSAAYLSVLALIYVYLVINVVKNRVSSKVVIGDGDNEDLKYAIRAQSNFAEHLPLAGILLIAIDLQAGSMIAIHIFGVILILARVLHISSLLYFERIKNFFKFRVFGTAGTMFSIMLMAIYNIILYFTHS